MIPRYSIKIDLANKLITISSFFYNEKKRAKSLDLTLLLKTLKTEDFKLVTIVSK